MGMSGYAALQPDVGNLVNELREDGHDVTMWRFAAGSSCQHSATRYLEDLDKLIQETDAR